MKTIFKYYLFLERPILILILILFLLLMTMLLVLITSGIIDMIGHTSNYYQIRETQEAICLTLFEENQQVYWKDETFMGFGTDGSYGCFLTIEEQGE